MRHRRITASQVVLIRCVTTQPQLTTQRARRAHTVDVSRTSTEARTSSDLSSPMSVSTRLGQPSATTERDNLRRTQKDGDESTSQKKRPDDVLGKTSDRRQALRAHTAQYGSPRSFQAIGRVLPACKSSRRRPDGSYKRTDTKVAQAHTENMYRRKQALVCDRRA